MLIDEEVSDCIELSRSRPWAKRAEPEVVGSRDWTHYDSPSRANALSRAPSPDRVRLPRVGLRWKMGSGGLGIHPCVV